MNLKNNSYIRIIKWILFCIILICEIFLISNIVSDKVAKKNIYSLRYESKDTIDVIFLGNSHANNAFIPMEL